MDPSKISGQEKVQKWLQDSSSSCQPSSTSNCSDKPRTYCDPFDLCDKIKSCPICTVEYSIPSESLDCIRSHNKHLCYFCLELINIEEVHSHYVSSGHYKDEIRLTVNCPYRSCDPDDIFGYPDGIKHHILNDHLPNSFNFSDEELSEETCSEFDENDSINESEQTENEADVEMKSETGSQDSDQISEPSQQIRSISSNQVSSTVKSEVGTENQFVLDYSILKMETPGVKYDPDMKFKSPGSSDDDDLVFIESVKVPEARVRPNPQKYFVCQSCDKIFSCRAALINHSAKGYKRCTDGKRLENVS